jgi:hypothetical protein
VDELYVIARRVLLDALEALGPHRRATRLVGAQAIYLHTGAANLAIAEFTTDADIAIDPALLDEFPPLEEALQKAGFIPLGSKGVGVWKTPSKRQNHRDVEVQVDLLVPSEVSPGRGRRAARLPGHGELAARKVDGLVGVLVDHTELEIASLEPETDKRRITTTVAGPGALLVAKLFKISERKGTTRSNDKDALDVLRLLQGVETETLAAGLRLILQDDRSKTAGSQALQLLRELFGTRGSDGAAMAARATQPLMNEEQIRLSCEALAGDLLAILAPNPPPRG